MTAEAELPDRPSEALVAHLRPGSLRIVPFELRPISTRGRGARLCPISWRRGAESNDAAGCADLVLVMNVYFASGLGLHEAIRRAAEYSTTPAAVELLRCLGHRDTSRPLQEALSQWASKIGGHAAHIESTLRLADSYGAAVGSILQQLAEDSRLEIRATRLQRAGQLPIKSLLPVVCCFLPGFLLLTLVPVVVGVMQGLKF